MLSLSSSFSSKRKLETLVENRTIHTLNNAELNIFETHQQAKEVLLKFPDPVLASMLTGKKIMHLQGLESFDFLPGESVILPQNELMCIDFPEATTVKPTQCLALAFSTDLIKSTIQVLNEKSPKQEGKEWKMTDYNFHFTNDIAIQQILQRLIFIFAENHPSKDIFADSLLQELLIRIVQTESKGLHLKNANASCTDDRISYIIKFIKENITKHLSVEDLSDKAYMSESSFYRIFKNEMGISPNDFIIEERIKIAEEILKKKKTSIKEAYLASGFNSFSYFCRVFKKKKNISPSQYKAKENSLAQWVN